MFPKSQKDVRAWRTQHKSMGRVCLCVCCVRGLHPFGNFIRGDDELERRRRAKRMALKRDITHFGRGSAAPAQCNI